MPNCLALATFYCACCGDAIEVNYDRLKANRPKVRCPHCHALFAVDTDAEFINGVWVDRTKLWRV